MDKIKKDLKNSFQFQGRRRTAIKSNSNSKKQIILQYNIKAIHFIKIMKERKKDK